MDEDPTVSDYNINTSSPSYIRNNNLLLCPKCKFNPIRVTYIKIDTTIPVIEYYCSSCKSKEECKIEDLVNSMNMTTFSISNLKCARRGHECVSAEAFCFNCKKAFCNDCLTVHELITTNHQLTTKTFSLKSFCQAHNNFSLNILCTNCNEVMCSQCQLIHDNTHKCIYLDEYYSKLSRELVYGNYEEFANVLKERGDKMQQIIRNKCEIIDEIKAKLDEYKEMIKNSKSKGYDNNVRNYKKLVEMIFNGFNSCGENNNYNYDIISSLKVLNEVFKKDCKNYEKLEKEYKEDIQLLKSFKDNELEDILHFKQKKEEQPNNKQSTQKKHRKIKKIIKPSVNSNENNNTDSSATHSIDSRSKTERKAINKSFIFPKESSKTEIKTNRNPLSFNSNNDLYPKLTKYEEYRFIKEIVCMVLLPENIIAIGGGKWSTNEDKEINDYSISFYSPSSNLKLSQLRGHSCTVACIFLMKNGYLVSGDFKSEIIIWDYKTQRIIKKLKHGNKAVRILTDFSSSEFLYSFSDDKTMKIWNIKDDYKLVQSVEIDGGAYCVKQLTVSTALIGFGKKIFEIYDIANKKVINSIKTNSYVMSILPLKQILILGFFNGSVRLYDDNYKDILIKKIHKQTVTQLIEIEPNVIVSSSWDNTIKVWRFTNNDLVLLNIYIEHTNSILCLLQIDNSTIISGSTDKKIIMWKKKEKDNTIKGINFNA